MESTPSMNFWPTRNLLESIEFIMPGTEYPWHTPGAVLYTWQVRVLCQLWSKCQRLP